MNFDRPDVDRRPPERVADVSSFADADRILQSLQDLAGRKWHFVIVYHLLADGSMGFSELKERPDGISSKMLSESLDTLEEAEIVDRRLLSDQPIRVEYSLTERGAALEPVLASMLEWGRTYGIATDRDDGETSGNEDATS